MDDTQQTSETTTNPNVLSSPKSQQFAPSFLKSDNPIDPDAAYVLGIDEAGRGPVLGPMVYGCCFCPTTYKPALSRMGFADSKTLNEQQRDHLFGKIRRDEVLGWEVIPISAEELSAKMLKIDKINLNTISHNAAIDLIKHTVARGAKVQQVFVDTVGDPKKYQDKLQRIFPTMQITVSKKADSLFPIVSAASICAKVMRDHMIKNWQYKESNIKSTNLGSGYPADPVTKEWLVRNLDYVFGYPSIMRFSWKTCDQCLLKAAKVTWSLYDDDDEAYPPRKQPKLNFKSNDRHHFFADANLNVVSQL